MSTPEEAPSSENIFGLDDDTANEALADLADIEETPEEAPEEVEPEPEAEAEPEPVIEGEPVEAEAEPEVEVEPEVETIAEAEARKFADRYDSIEDLEAGYKHVQGAFTKTQQELLEAQKLKAQYEAALQQIAPHLPKLKAVLAEEQEAGYMPEVDPEQRAQQIAQEQFTTWQRQQAQQAESQVVNGFIQSHPDVVPGSPVAIDVFNIVREYQATANIGTDPVVLETAYNLAKEPRVRGIFQELALDPRIKENVDVARECASNTRLHKILKAEPHLADTDEGLELARERAGTPAPRLKAAQPEDKKRVHVETGSTGAPLSGAPGETPDDSDWIDTSTPKSVFGF